MNADRRRSKTRKRKSGTTDVLNDLGLLRQIEKSRAFYAAGGKGLSFENVFGEPLRPVRKGRR
jgi:hypothetical protein